MFDFFDAEAPAPSPRQIAASFRTLGWVGFIFQSLLGFIPILVVVMTVLFSPGQRQIGFSFGLWLAIACLGILLFSIYWCFRYTLLAAKLEDPDLRPGKSKVVKDLKLGLVANIGIMAIAVFIAITRVGALTFKMLTTPPGSTIVTPGSAATMVAQGAIITPSNMIAVQAMLNAIAAGLVGIIVALILLYRVGQHRNAQ